MRGLLTTLAAIVTLAGCATSYQPAGLSGGFSETQLDTNVVRVTFKGNGFTKADQAEEMTLLRSAEVMLDKGYPFFILAASNNRTDYSSYTSAAQTNTTGTVNPYTGQIRATSYTTGGQTTVIASPSTVNTVVGFKERPTGVNGMVYSAKFIMESLGPKYKK